jgi:Flp pilus assembly protein protease CpaA
MIGVFDVTIALWPIGVLAVGLGLIVLAWTDVRRFEIDPVALILVIAGTCCVYLDFGTHLGANLGASTMLLIVGVTVRWFKPKWLGEGDLGLLATMGFLSGALVLLYTTALLFALLVVGFVYARLRRKPRIFSGVPLALPATLVGAPIFFLQIMGLTQ